MIQPVEKNSAPREANEGAGQPARKAHGTSFASLHAAALGTGVGIDSSATVPASTVSEPSPTSETWAPVPGQRFYAKIADGPRAGQYVNLALGDRHGEAFTIEQRGGKAVHVYGSGADAKVFDAAHDAAHGPRGRGRANDQPPTGETWAPVAHTSAYADILGGPRNGLFVNTSGGIREGMAFQIVRQNGKTYHVYGSGSQRQMIEIRHRAHPHPSSAAAPGGATPAQAAGGGMTAPKSSQ